MLRHEARQHASSLASLAYTARVRLLLVVATCRRAMVVTTTNKSLPEIRYSGVRSDPSRGARENDARSFPRATPRRHQRAEESVEVCISCGASESHSDSTLFPNRSPTWVYEEQRTVGYRYAQNRFCAGNGMTRKHLLHLSVSHDHRNSNSEDTQPGHIWKT